MIRMGNAISVIDCFFISLVSLKRIALCDPCSRGTVVQIVLHVLALLWGFEWQASKAQLDTQVQLASSP